MDDNVVNLGADEKLRQEADEYYRSLFGPKRAGFDLFVEGRCIPKITICEEGDEVCFVLDGRFGFNFPKDWAGQAAAFAANAMAIGAGYAHLSSESKERPFAPQVMEISSDTLGSPQ